MKPLQIFIGSRQSFERSVPDVFQRYLIERCRYFVHELGWDIPNNNVVEFDQYDNPNALYYLLCDSSGFLAGYRALPMESYWGSFSTMINDMHRECLWDFDDTDLVRQGEFECSRFVMSSRALSISDQPLHDYLYPLVARGLQDLATGSVVLHTNAMIIRFLRSAFTVSYTGRFKRAPDCGRSYAVVRLAPLSEQDVIPSLVWPVVLPEIDLGLMDFWPHTLPKDRIRA